MGKIMIICFALLIVAGFEVSSASSAEIEGQGTNHHGKMPTINYDCPPTAPRYNLNLTKMMGQWYPILLTRTAATLWSESFQKDHPQSNTTPENCFFVEYGLKDYQKFNKTLHMTLSRGNQWTTVDASVIADEDHPTYSKWVVEWPTGEETLMSIVATGALPRDDIRYSWLLVVNCDLKNAVRPDWAILVREKTEMSEAGLNAILGVVEGLEGKLMHDDLLSHASTDCIH